MSPRLRSVVVTAVVAMCAAATPAWADLKIGVVQYARLMQESPQAKVAQDALRGEFAGKQKELQTQQAALKSKEESLQKDGATMTLEQRNKIEKDLRDGNRELQQKVQEYQDDFNARQNEELSGCRRRWSRKCGLRVGREVRPGAGGRCHFRRPGARYHAAGTGGHPGARHTHSGRGFGRGCEACHAAQDQVAPGCRRAPRSALRTP